jgi:HrpA-like RNA helicase
VSQTVRNINGICENIELLDINFKKCVNGYHLINSSYINEKTWEDRNAMIFSSVGIDIYSKTTDGDWQYTYMDMDEIKSHSDSTKNTNTDDEWRSA